VARRYVALLVAVALQASPALACVDPPPAEHVPDATIADTQPPGIVGDVSYSVFRGNDREIAEADGCGQREVRTSCKGNARITFFIEPPSPAEPAGDAGAEDASAADDAAPADEGGATTDAGETGNDAGAAVAEHVGYVFELVDGEAPEGLLPEAPVLAADDGSIELHWNDGDDDDQEMVSFSVSVRAVDDAGNLGEPSDPIHVFDAGSTESGCSITRGLLGSWMPSALLSLGALLLGARASKRVMSRIGSGVGRVGRRR